MEARPANQASSQATLLHHAAAERILTTIQCSSPLILLIFFLVAFTIRSVHATAPDVAKANGHASSEQLLGPGGKPLPQRALTGFKRIQDKNKDFPRSQKLIFQWFSVLATLTYLGSATFVVIHVFVDRGWWCGQQQVVSLMFYHAVIQFTDHIPDLCRRLLYGLHSTIALSD